MICTRKNWKRVIFILLLLLSMNLQVGAQDDDIGIQYIEDIICKGNKQTSSSFIKKEYYQDVGDILDPEAISDATLRLGALNRFEDVRFYLEKGSEKGKVIVVIEVVEAEHLQLELDLGKLFEDSQSFTSNNEYHGGAKITNFNFLGLGKIFETYIYTREEQHAFITQTDKSIVGMLRYTDPHFLQENKIFLSTGLKFNSHNEYSLDFDTNITDSKPFKKYRNFGTLDVEFGKRIFRCSYLSIAAEFVSGSGESRYEGRKEGTDDSFSEYALSFTYGWNSQDDNLFPTSGSSFLTSTTIGYNTSNNHTDTFVISSWLVYNQHWSLSNNQVVTLRLSSIPREEEYRFENNGISMRYTFLLQADSYRHRAWFCEQGFMERYDIAVEDDFVLFYIKSGLILEFPYFVIKGSLMWYLELDK